MRKKLSFEFVLTDQGLLDNQQIEIDETGTILAVQRCEGKPADGWIALPGMVNAHSHCFQRAMCGYGEQKSGDDSFWSWRTAMYRLANRITPDSLHIIARTAFSEMLCAGYTTVGEFHYLHHLPDGMATPDMAQAVVAAARESGIDLVMLPVLYQYGGLDENGHKPPSRQQKRFVHATLDAYLELLSSLSDVTCGFAPHSLRAVAIEDLDGILDAVRALIGSSAPVHMHIAEQRAELEDCELRYGVPPVRALANHVELDSRWNLVHATHCDAAELQLIADSGARVVVCPLTEAYLGDGIFPAADFIEFGGRLAIGSDSNVRICAVEELRMLEFTQRLAAQRRALLSDSHGVGSRLWRHAASAGALALGRDCGTLAAGQRADIVVLDKNAAPLNGPEPAIALDALLVGGSRECISDVYVGGRQKVSNGVPVDAPDAPRFAKTVADLMRDE